MFIQKCYFFFRPKHTFLRCEVSLVKLKISIYSKNFNRIFKSHFKQDNE